MRKVGLKILKNKLSEYVRLAAAGETIVMTDRGRVVAEIVPPRRRTRVGHRARHPRGLDHDPRRDPVRPLPPRKPIPGYTLDQLMADLERDREDRW